MHDYDPCYYRSHSGFPDPCSCIYYSGTISIVGDLASGFETGLRRILPRRTHISGTSWLVPIGRCDAAENVNYIALSISDHYVSFCRPYRTLQNEVLCTRCTNDETSPSHTRTSGCWFGINIFYFIEASRPYVTVILKSFFSFFFSSSLAYGVQLHCGHLTVPESWVNQSIRDNLSPYSLMLSISMWVMFAVRSGGSCS